jgi:hypothetical protein
VVHVWEGGVAGVILLAHINCSVSTIYIVIQLITVNNLKLFIMNVYILTVDAYDNYAQSMGTKILGVYATEELAKKDMLIAKQWEHNDDFSIDYSYSIEQATVEGI